MHTALWHLANICSKNVCGCVFVCAVLYVNCRHVCSGFDIIAPLQSSVLSLRYVSVINTWFLSSVLSRWLRVSWSYAVMLRWGRHSVDLRSHWCETRKPTEQQDKTWSYLFPFKPEPKCGMKHIKSGGCFITWYQANRSRLRRRSGDKKVQVSHPIVNHNSSMFLVGFCCSTVSMNNNYTFLFYSTTANATNVPRNYTYRYQTCKLNRLVYAFRSKQHVCQLYGSKYSYFFRDCHQAPKFAQMWHVAACVSITTGQKAKHLSPYPTFRPAAWWCTAHFDNSLSAETVVFCTYFDGTMETPRDEVWWR